MVDIKSFNLTELEDYVAGLSEQKYRARQLYEWLHAKCETDAEQMSNLPKSFKEKLSRNAEIVCARPVEIQASKTDGTKKYLFEFSDGECVESVFMRYKHGNSVCISSQAGCRMGCKFCASTLDGLKRNLTPSELLEQIYAIKRDVGERISNIVVMGTGEPLDNFDTLIKFIELISDKNGLNISQRNITVSTCGIAPNILRLSEYDFQITLALSLHAVTDEKRREIMPVALSYSIDELMDACKKYFKRTGRRISFEYSLIAGKNDSDEDAEGLIRLSKRVSAHVNLIPVNPIKERDYRRTGEKRVRAFKEKLESGGVNATIRRELGTDIDGACGQLRHRRNAEFPKQLTVPRK